MKEPPMNDPAILRENSKPPGAGSEPMLAGDKPAIQAEGIRKRYGELDVLKGVDLTLGAGQFTAIMGKSGSGKSTLLGIIAGLERPDAGQVLVMGQKLAGMSDHDIASLRRRLIGIVFQGFSLIPSLTALDNVLLPTFFAAHMTAVERRQRATDLLNQVELGARLNYRPSALSGGEQQRVAIARALINRPSVLLADEPTGNLDQATGTAVLDLLIDLGRTHGTALLMVTHDPDVAARADNVVEMKDGRISHGQA
jgi:putative ABC transport system ATP-binding protein